MSERSGKAPEPLAQLRHDLRTPINQIIGYGEMLQEDAVRDGHAGYVGDLQKIQDAARTLLGLINTKLQDGVQLSAAAAPAPAHPAKVAPQAMHGDAGQAPQEADDALARFAGHVLAVDDNASNREVLARRLERHGLTVTTAVDGQDALDKIAGQAFDLVLLDVMMPVLDGYSVLRRMKADPATKDVPVIMISALDEIESVVRCIEAGAEDYLPKPFNPTLLRARIGACLEKKALRDAERLHLHTIEQTKRRLDEELSDAATYVRSIFPAPVDAPLRVDWKQQPCTELGGDAFGYHWIDADHFAVYLLDVCGHGVGASLLSVTAINVIRSGALPNTDLRDPGAVLAALNNAFLMERQNDLYFTMWYGVYHAPSRTLRHASGGHPPALLVMPGTASAAGAVSSRLLEKGMIIGAMEDLPFSSSSCTVPPGACLLVICDGCYEILRPDGRTLEFEDFEAFMRDRAMEPEALDALYAWAQEHSGGRGLDDDFSIVRIRFPA